MLKAIFDAAHSSNMHMHVLQLLQSLDHTLHCMCGQAGRNVCVCLKLHAGTLPGKRPLRPA